MPDVERSLVLTKMLTKQNVSVKYETVKGLRATKAVVQDYGGVQNVPITLGMIKVVRKSHHLYTEHLRQEAAKKSTKEGEKAKAEAQREIKRKESWRESSRWEASEAEKWKREGHMMQWENQCLTLMKVERKYMMDSKQAIWWKLKQETNLIEFGRQKQSEAKGRLEDISKEMDLVWNQLTKNGSKKTKW